METEMLLVILSFVLSLSNSLFMLFKRIKKSDCQVGSIRMRTESTDEPQSKV